MKAIALEFARRLVGSGDFNAHDIIHFGPTYYETSAARHSGASRSSVAVAAMLVTGSVVAAAANASAVESRARRVMDYVVTRDRVARSSTGKAVGVYLRPLGTTITVRLEGKEKCAVRAVPSPSLSPVSDQPSPEEELLATLPLPSCVIPGGKNASFARYRSSSDGRGTEDRADCVFIDGLGWFVVVQRHGRVHVGVTRFAAADLIESVDCARPSRFAAVAEVSIKGGAAPLEA